MQFQLWHKHYLYVLCQKASMKNGQFEHSCHLINARIFNNQTFDAKAHCFNGRLVHTAGCVEKVSTFPILTVNGKVRYLIVMNR